MSVAAIASRVAQIAALVLALSFVLFGVLAFLPGDPVDLLVLSNPSVRSEDVAALKEQRGLDKPWPVRWWRWLAGHDAPRTPPRAPPAPDVIVELGADGRALVTVPITLSPGQTLRAPVGTRVDGAQLLLEAASPGVLRLPFAVVDEHGLEDAGVVTIFVSPFLGGRPGGGTLETGGSEERQQQGSTEGTTDGPVTDAGRVQAARAAGTFGAEAVARTFAKGTPLDVDARAFCPGAPCDVALDRRAFSGPGRTVRFGTASREGAVVPIAVVVDHGAVADPARFHRGAAFALLGDTEALGYSQTYKRPVWELLFGAPLADDTRQLGASSKLARRVQTWGRVQNTLSLMLPAMLLAALLSVLLGTWAAARPGAAVDRTIGAVGLLGVSMPAFWLGIMGIVVVAGSWRFLPAGGAQTPGLPPVLADVVADRLRHMVMPVLVLAFVYTATWMRTVRASVLEVMPQPLVRTARAKGATRAGVLVHALRNALLPFITVVTLSIPAVFSGALLTETVFSWPGVGRLQYEAILNNDSYVAIVVFVVSSALVMTGSLVADVLYAVVDPRVRTRRRSRP